MIGPAKTSDLRHYLQVVLVCLTTSQTSQRRPLIGQTGKRSLISTLVYLLDTLYTPKPGFYLALAYNNVRDVGINLYRSND
jgi:hypothetical protein